MQGTEDLRLDAVPTENRTDWGAASMSQRTCKAFLRVSPLCLYFPFERLNLTYLSSCALPQKKINSERIKGFGVRAGNTVTRDTARARCERQLERLQEPGEVRSEKWDYIRLKSF